MDTSIITTEWGEYENVFSDADNDNIEVTGNDKTNCESKQQIMDWEQVKIQIYSACAERFLIAVYNWSATPHPFVEFRKYHDGVVVGELRR